MLRRLREGFGGRTPLSASSWYAYVKGLVGAAAVTAAGFWIAPTVAPTNLAIFYLLVVAITALRLGRGPAIITAGASAIAFDFFFVPPYRSFAITDIWYLITFLGLLSVALIVSALASQAREREAYSAAAYSLTKELIPATRFDDIVKIISNHLDAVLGQQTVVLMAEPGGLKVVLRSPDFQFDNAELAAAEQAAALPDASGEIRPKPPHACYFPLRTSRRMIGLLGVKPRRGRWLTGEQARLIDAFAGQSALAIERALLEQKARQADLLQKADKLRNALLHSVSHNLRTPVASLTGVLDALNEQTVTLDSDARTLLLRTARQDVSRLDHLIENLLSMSRLEAGAVVIHKAPHAVRDVVSAAIAECRGVARSRLSIDIPADVPIVLVDFILIEQVLVNLIDNASKYSTDPSPIEVGARREDGQVAISVRDRGIGIPAGELPHIFDRFMRAAEVKFGAGMGLGLSICKGFVEAHGGRIEAQPRPGGGTIVTFTVPAADVTQIQ